METASKTFANFPVKTLARAIGRVAGL